MTPHYSYIEKEIKKILPGIRKIRHHLHAHPELSLKEFNTSELIRAKLSTLDIKIYDPFLGTDIVALLPGKTKGKNVTLRADMDALPLQEKNNQSHRSTVENTMHACGHDGHAAILLGSALILEKLKNSFNGSVRFVFQPGEEIVAAGKDLVRKGVLKKPEPDAVLALHSWPGIPTGAICSRPGPFMAAADIFRLTIKGKGGHGSTPHESIDTILTAGRVINGLCLLSSRKTRAQDPVVISTCSIHGGSNANVIPGEVILTGSVRYLSHEVGQRLPELIEDAVKAECSYTGADYDLEYERPYIATINDSQVVNAGKEVTEHYPGNLEWRELSEPVMGSEDFSYYINKNPGAMFFLGMGEDCPPLHSSTFDFNDEALHRGILFFVLTTLRLLS